MNKFCGRCGKALGKNQRSVELGFCSPCRKPPPDGQLSFVLAEPSQKKQKNKSKRKTRK